MQRCTSIKDTSVKGETRFLPRNASESTSLNAARTMLLCCGRSPESASPTLRYSDELTWSILVTVDVLTSNLTNAGRRIESNRVTSSCINTCQRPMSHTASFTHSTLSLIVLNQSCYNHQQGVWIKLIVAQFPCVLHDHDNRSANDLE